jgi:hypothetical protein
MLLTTMPAALYGPAETPTMTKPLDPTLVSGFTDYESYQQSNFTPFLTAYAHFYDLNGLTWWAATDNATVFQLAAEVRYAGLWLGGIDICDFVNANGTNRGNALSFAEITLDSVQGTARYSLISEDSGANQGTLVTYWNTTAYTNATQAWLHDDLGILHGIGFTPNTNIINLLLSLLTLSLPNTPVEINILLLMPVVVAIIYIIWFIVKESLPFV